MKKIIIIGSPGAGKTTFANNICRLLKLPVYHLDSIWYNPDKTHVPKKDFDNKIRKIMEGDKWVLDGNYTRTMEERIKKCDTVFFLDCPLEVCLEGIQSRVGRKRDDLPWVEAELNEDFREYVVNFPAENIPKIYDLLETYKDKKEIYIFKSRKEAKDFLKTLTKEEVL